MKRVLNNIAKHKEFNTRQGEYNSLLRQYKQLFQEKRRHYQQVLLSQLEHMRTEDTNAYWKFWKSRNAGPTLSQFVEYFEQQVYSLHVDYFDYYHMNKIIKLVTSCPSEFYKHDCNELLPACVCCLIPLLLMENIHQVGYNSSCSQKKLTIKCPIITGKLQ